MRKPLDFLNGLLDKEVLVRLKNGVEIGGKLKTFDLHLNLVLEDARLRDGEVEKRLASVFVRGDMVLLIS